MLNFKHFVFVIRETKQSFPKTKTFGSYFIISAAIKVFIMSTTELVTKQKK
jgi:hypothetical protein